MQIYKKKKKGFWFILKIIRLRRIYFVILEKYVTSENKPYPQNTSFCFFLMRGLVI